MQKTLKTILERQVLKYPMMTAAEMQTSVAELWMVSQWTFQQTLQNDLKMLSIQYVVTAIKPLLMDKMMTKRVKCAKALSVLRTRPR